MQDMIKIRYLGRTPKTVDLPIPFLSRSDRAGQVICDPVGIFPKEDGERLLEICGPGGLFILEPFTQEEVGPLCACGCGENIVILPQHKFKGIPKYRHGHFKPNLPKGSPIQASQSEGEQNDHPAE
jgi:hypothetical protein